ncbi:MAG: tetratricopeptide repeat protein [Gemmataceae bacterium]
MLTCPNPTCRRHLPRLDRQCPHCRTDLSLLVSYVEDLQGSLEQAEELTRAGRLAEAVWTYLEVLEVDPDNATARQQVGQVVAAVRHFDRVAPGRQWLQRQRRRSWWRQRGRLWREDGSLSGGAWLLLWLGSLLLAVGVGYGWGQW